MQFKIIIGYASKTKLCGLLLGYRTTKHGENKDGRLEPRSKAQHDKPMFEKYKKARQDMHPKFSQQEQGSSKRPSRAMGGSSSGAGGSSPPYPY